MTALKALVASLVLANAGYFLWDRGNAMAPDGLVDATKTLRLASEVAAGGNAPAAPGAEAIVPAALSSVPAAAAIPPVLPASEPVAPASASASRVGVAQRCVSVGPFREVSEAARAAGSLRTGGYDPRQRVADGEVWAGVWVYLPLPIARTSTDQILDRLKTAGMDDALEMPGPNDTSVISLGLFSEPKRAQARVAQAQTLGFNPGIADRKRNGNVYWIDIDLKPTDAMLNPSKLQDDTGHMRLQVKACPGATGETVAAGAMP